MLQQASGAGNCVASRAEHLPFCARAFDAVVAGQCWHWFDRTAAAEECSRVLREGGLLALAHYDYLPFSGNVAERTEQLILEHNPTWLFSGGNGRYDVWRPDLESAGFSDIQILTYDEDATYSHESWRGRIRACNGVLALPDDAQRAQLDERLAEILAKEFPGQLLVPHRIFVIWGRKPGRP
jgi:SAM-dependent methyltransferase